MENEVWDKVSEDRIKTLHPAVRDKARAFINAVEHELGIKLRVVEGFRSFQKQDGYYNQPTDGIDNDKDGKIDEPDERITNAKGGQSYHNYGLALDVAPIVNGKPDYKNVPWEKIAAIAKRLGFKWGEPWGDKPHFEMSFGKSYKQLQQMYAAGQVDTQGYLKLA